MTRTILDDIADLPPDQRTAVLAQIDLMRHAAFIKGAQDKIAEAEAYILSVWLAWLCMAYR